MPEQSLWPLALYFGAVLALVAFVLALSSVLGERHGERATGDPFESGVVPVQPARIRFSVKFYIVAMLFVVFDLEAVYIVAWAVIARDAGWSAYIEIAIFIAILLACLAYLWRLGALEWGTRPEYGAGAHRRIAGAVRPASAAAGTRGKTVSSGVR
jgi:NADH-quinone oxidoreductase subunit A